MSPRRGCYGLEMSSAPPSGIVMREIIPNGKKLDFQLRIERLVSKISVPCKKRKLFRFAVIGFPRRLLARESSARKAPIQYNRILPLPGSRVCPESPRLSVNVLGSLCEVWTFHSRSSPVSALPSCRTPIPVSEGKLFAAAHGPAHARELVMLLSVFDVQQQCLRQGQLLTARSRCIHPRIMSRWEIP
jgi:hypothetical protein